MILRTDIQSSFLNLFTKAMGNEPLTRDNRLNMFVLKIANNEFDYGGLTDELQNSLITYALSRHTVDELVVQEKKYGKQMKTKAN